MSLHPLVQEILELLEEEKNLSVYGIISCLADRAGLMNPGLWSADWPIYCTEMERRGYSFRVVNAVIDGYPGLFERVGNVVRVIR